MNLLQARIGTLFSRFPCSSLALQTQSLHYSFSEFFEKQDKEEMGTFSVRKLQNKMYRSLLRQWQKPLEKKRLRRERIAIIKANEKVPQPEPDKMVVHNAAVGVQFPALPTEEFCIILVDNFQYKVMKDSVLVLDRKPEHDLNLIINFPVLLYGSKTYTLLGRPILQNTHVEAIVQSMSDSEKVIVFKKKRRKQYKKSFGAKITRIIHDLLPDVTTKAVNLQ